MRVCGCVPVCVCGCVVAWVRECFDVRVCAFQVLRVGFMLVCVGALVCGCAWLRLCGFLVCDFAGAWMWCWSGVSRRASLPEIDHVGRKTEPDLGSIFRPCFWVRRAKNKGF